MEILEKENEFAEPSLKHTKKVPYIIELHSQKSIENQQIKNKYMIISSLTSSE